MQRFLIWGISLLCLGGVARLLLVAPESLQIWWNETFQGEMVRWLPNLPILLLVMAGLWGRHLREGKMTLLAILLLGAHVVPSVPLPEGLTQDFVREGLCVFLPWAFPFLLSWPETSLRNPWGRARLGAALFTWFLSFVWAINHGFAEFWPSGLAVIPGGVKSLSALLAFLVLWILPFAERPSLRLSWTCALISLGLASLHGEPWWPQPVSSAPWPVFSSFCALFLLGGLYGLTWRRVYLDELTEIPGRRAFEESLRRLGKYYAIAMVDVDHFKHFNDRYGHQVGDQILRFIAARLKKVPFGQAFRYGGEEFALIMPGRRIRGIVSLLDEVRRSIGESKFTIRGGNRPLQKPRRKDMPSGGRKQVAVTVSIGVARKLPLHPNPESVVKAADEALYRAKQIGRNRVETKRWKKGESFVRRINWKEGKSVGLTRESTTKGTLNPSSIGVGDERRTA